MDRNNITRRGRIRVGNLLVYCFAVWPFFWSFWNCQRLPQALLGEHLPVFFMFALALLSFVITPVKLKKPMMLWLLFYLVTLLEISHARISMYVQDIGINISSWLICVSVGQTDYNRDKVIRYIRAIGFFIAFSVIMERSILLFSGVLRPLYTAEALDTVRGVRGFGGGFLPLSSFAGCFIVPGLAALVIMESGKRRTPRYYVIIAIYTLSLVFLRKRGFILDIILGTMFLKYLDLRSHGKIALRKNKTAQRLLTAAGLLLLLHALYYFVPTIQEALDSLMAKIFEEDWGFSGRDKLYTLAFAIFLENPLTGIGWGQYRERSLGVFLASSTKTYEVHNVYLQLLCENGILGLLTFLLATGSVLIFSSKKYLKLSSTRAVSGDRIATVKLSVFLQVFFLSYCISGNPLYDYIFVVTYFIGVLLAFV